MSNTLGPDRRWAVNIERGRGCRLERGPGRGSGTEYRTVKGAQDSPIPVLKGSEELICRGNGVKW